MLNYIAIGLVSWMFDTWFVVGADTLNVKTKELPRTAWFPELVKGKLTGFVFIVLVVIVLFWVLVWKTKFGFHLRASGANPGAARVAGVNSSRMIMTAMLMSGAIAGLVGMPGLLGDTHAYRRGLAEDYGFNGIAVALLGRNHPVGMAVGALLWSFLDVSAQILDLESVPKEITIIMQGVIVLSVVIAYELVRRIGIAQEQRRVRAKLAATTRAGASA
jgi:simple sugar transport system permease protein